ncbi:MAG: RluA family pseudouridine synthase [Burkholderiales bacterium]
MKDLAKSAAKSLEIDADSAGQRLDNFLMRTLKGVPKSHVYRIVRSGEVRVNKGRARADTRLATGDVVRLPPLALTPASPKAGPTSLAARAGAALPVIFEGDGLLAVDKPCGIAVHGGSGLSFGVIEALRAQRGDGFLELVHRLDRDTSGALLLATSRAALVGMHALLRDGKVDKRYVAMVRGEWPHAAKHHIRIALAARVLASGEKRVRASDDAEDDDAREAHSVVSVLSRHADATLLEVQLKTGRTHQIRVHLSASGHPILGDDKYGDFALNRREKSRGFSRMFLHAKKLSFVHPLSGERMRVEAPLPPACVARLAADAA